MFVSERIHPMQTVFRLSLFTAACEHRTLVSTHVIAFPTSETMEPLRTRNQYKRNIDVLQTHTTGMTVYNKFKGSKE